MTINFQNFFAPGSKQVNNFNGDSSSSSSSSSSRKEETCNNADVQQSNNTCVQQSANSCVQQPVNPDSCLEPKKTSPRKSVSGIVVTNQQYESTVLAALDSLMKGKSNKDAANVIQAAILAGVIFKPTYSQFCSRYGNNVIGKTMYGRYVGADKVTLQKEDLKPLIAEFRKIMC